MDINAIYISGKKVKQMALCSPFGDTSPEEVLRHRAISIWGCV